MTKVNARNKGTHTHTHTCTKLHHDTTKFLSMEVKNVQITFYWTGKK